jgi:hypothetical protein
MELDQSPTPAAPARTPISLPQALGIYAACLVVALFVLTPALVLFGHQVAPQRPGMLILLFLLLHLGIGVFLSRKVLRNLIEWHPFLATLETVANAKIGMVIFWPIRYPVLFVKIAASKHL